MDGIVLCYHCCLNLHVLHVPKRQACLIFIHDLISQRERKKPKGNVKDDICPPFTQSSCHSFGIVNIVLCTILYTSRLVDYTKLKVICEKIKDLAFFFCLVHIVRFNMKSALEIY
jgi:hypothetical protein